MGMHVHKYVRVKYSNKSIVVYFISKKRRPFLWLCCAQSTLFCGLTKAALMQVFSNTDCTWVLSTSDTRTSLNVLKTEFRGARYYG